MSARLAVESLAARAAGKLSRLAGTGGGTTLPGKLLWKLDPSAIDALAARLPDGAAVVSATNGKTTTTAMAAEILEPNRRLAWNRSGANLASGVASTLLTQRDAELGLLEVDEGALPEIARRVRPRAVLLGNLFRDQLDRYGELEHIAANWRAATAALPQETVLVVNGDDPQVGDLGRDRAGTIAFGIDDPAHARPTLQHAADSRYCVRCGRMSSPRPTSVISATTTAPRVATPGPRSRYARARSSSTGSRASPSSSRRPQGRRASGCRCRGSTTSTTRSGQPHSRRSSARVSTRSGRGLSGSALPSDASSASPPATRRFSCC
jgi:UDP-N-acetylmuramyl tripeptide synthase